MKVVLAGASGLIGTAVASGLRADGHAVLRLVRRAPAGGDEAHWNPGTGEIDLRAMAGSDAVVNLAGENVGAGRWTVGRREALMRSRVDATRTLVNAIERSAQRPRVLVNASAVGFYGDRGDEILTETAAMGRGFLPEVTWAWETHAQRAELCGVRTLRLRFGVVLAREGGALARMVPAFRFGLGGPLGSGRQWMSWVTLTDAVRAIRFCLESAGASGAVNVVAPNPVTNGEFSLSLGRALHRPAFLPVPAWVLRALVGRGMADEALLASTRAQPQALLAGGFIFRHPTLAEAWPGLL